MTPFPPCSSQYLTHIHSVNLTSVQPERGTDKYSRLDTEGRESAWKIQCTMDLPAKRIIRVCVHWLEIAVQSTCGWLFASWHFFN